MAKQSGFWIGAALALCLAAPAPTLADTPKADTPTADTVVATVNGDAITLGDMIVLRSQLPARYQSVPDDKLFPVILDQLIQQQALVDTVKDKLSKRDKIAIANNRRAFIAGTAIDAVAKGATSDAAIKAAYDAKYANFKPGTEYHAAHILVKTEQEAKDLKAKIDAGADFAELAKKNSTDGSASNGGDLGWFKTGMMVKPFEDAVVKLKPGEVSDPVKTQFGWHLIKLDGTRPTKAPAMKDVRADLAKSLQQKAVTEHIAEVTKAAKVTRSIEGIDPAVLSDQKLLDQ